VPSSKADRPGSAWTAAGWRVAVEAWVGERLEALGTPPTGPLAPVSLRPWSAVLRTPTAAGDVYFKANVPALAHEPRLAALLHRRQPDRTLALLAVDEARGWLLMPDGGPTLRSAVDREGTAPWARVLPAFAGLQMSTAGAVPELLAAGAFDYRLAGLPAQLEGVIAGEAGLRAGEDALGGEERRALAGRLPRFRSLCEALAALGLPETLHHDDFHDANVFVGDGTGRVFDWHEGCVAHPFFSLLIALRVTAWRLGLDPAASELARMRDAYLEPWTALAPAAELGRALALALRVGRVTRALSWWRIITGVAAATRAASPRRCRAGCARSVPH
jgi:hypothetical protein